MIRGVRERLASTELVNQAVMAIGKGPRPEMLQGKAKDRKIKKKHQLHSELQWAEKAGEGGTCWGRRTMLSYLAYGLSLEI